MADQDIIEGVSGRHWHALPDGWLQCDICPRECKLCDGQCGLCFVRARRDGEIVLTTYGRSSGFCIDPIEKKPLDHFLLGTPVPSFGTAGCNLTCKFCQNRDISKSREMGRLMDEAPPEAIAAAAQQTGCRSVAYTYNDPVIFLEYAVDATAACRARDIRNVAVSVGYICPDMRMEFYDAMDAVNIDLKAFTEGFYKTQYFAELAAVQDTLVYIRHETDAWLEITTLLIPGENDSEAEIEAPGPDVPLHFSAFHPDYKMMDKPNTSPETLICAWRIAGKNGVRYAYTDNINHKAGHATLFGTDWLGRRCLATTRRKSLCQNPAIKGRSQCKLHRGRSTGPRHRRARFGPLSRARSTGDGPRLMWRRAGRSMTNCGGLLTN